MRAAHTLKVHGRALGVADGDGPPFRFVARQKVRATPAIEGRRELPGQVEGLAESRVHAVAASGRELVCCIAEQNDVLLRAGPGFERTCHEQWPPLHTWWYLLNDFVDPRIVVLVCVPYLLDIDISDSIGRRVMEMIEHHVELLGVRYWIGDDISCRGHPDLHRPY